MLPIERIDGIDYWRYTKWVSKTKATSAARNIKSWLVMRGALRVLEHPKRKGNWAVMMKMSRR